MDIPDKLWVTYEESYWCSHRNFRTSSLDHGPAYPVYYRGDIVNGLCETLQIARDYVVNELEDEKQAYKGYESSSNILTIQEDLERIDAALAKARGE